MNSPHTQPSSPLLQHAAMAALCLVTGWIAYVAFRLQFASAIEAIAFVSGAICVWLVVKRSIWNFPLGLLNVMASAYVLYNYKLYADAGLQGVYFVLNLMGWWMWLSGRGAGNAIAVTDADKRDWVAIALFIAGATVLLFFVLGWLGGAARFWDALTTSISLAAQWLLNRRKVQSWHLWILVDLIYVPLYISRELYLMALLYGIFLIMAVVGLLEWQKVRQRPDTSPETFA